MAAARLSLHERRAAARAAPVASMSKPSSLDAPIRPSNLPTGWVVLDPTTDMLPQFPEYTGTNVIGCTGAMPVYRDAEGAVQALTFDLNATPQLRVQPTAGWSAANWATYGAQWLQGDDGSNNTLLSLNWDENNSVPSRGFGGVVFPTSGTVVTAVSGSGALSTGYVSSSSTVAKQFTILLQLDTTAATTTVVNTNVGLNGENHNAYVWGGYVRRTGVAATTEVRHMLEFDDDLELEQVDDAQESALVHGAWYTLAYWDDDVIATPARRGEYDAFQAVLRSPSTTTSPRTWCLSRTPFPNLTRMISTWSESSCCS